VVRVDFNHVIRCSPERFWKGFLNPDTVARFYTRAIGFTKFTLLRQDEDETSISRDVDCDLPVPLSRPLRAIFRDGFRFVERGRFERDDNVWRFAWTPATLASRIRFNGWMRIVHAEEAPDASHRLVQIDVTARVPGLGSLIEHTAEKLLRESWEQSAVELNTWLAQGMWI
jgi:hypothetical protein